MERRRYDINGLVDLKQSFDELSLPSYLWTLYSTTLFSIGSSWQQLADDPFLIDSTTARLLLRRPPLPPVRTASLVRLNYCPRQCVFGRFCGDPHCRLGQASAAASGGGRAVQLACSKAWPDDISIHIQITNRFPMLKSSKSSFHIPISVFIFKMFHESICNASNPGEQQYSLARCINPLLLLDGQANAAFPSGRSCHNIAGPHTTMDRSSMNYDSVNDQEQFSTQCLASQIDLDDGGLMLTTPCQDQIESCGTQFETNDITTNFSRDDGNLENQYAIITQNRRGRRQKRLPGGFPCMYDDCLEVFNTAGDLRKHDQRKHQPESEWPLGCHQCERRFFDRRDLKRHVRSRHGCRVG